MRNKIIAGNWKMNTLVNEGVKLASSINEYFNNNKLTPNVKIIIGVPFTHIDACVRSVDYTKISVAAQNCSQYEKGAYTGEIAADMIKGLGAQYVIVGHSERRQIFGETDSIIAQKLANCHKNALFPILCCGETDNQRDDGSYFDVVKNQLIASLSLTDKFNVLRTVIAYEPVWAIGTGKTASPEQAQEMHEYIRKIITEIYNQNIADQISILYGGSVKPDNAVELFSQDDIDGGLIGGASLKKEDFIKIYQAI
ncbi:MAG: triose-phosphate isomerase [Bacteroidales bacterium]|nr:triose-phosphate isomerase [Bacteroidales bacterium]MDD4215794.1 triose-phosphate isomerase [Bacteroidales bacterium]MDY0142190.1 triose-phosphate isomerase [Bacteroidales bacterium]